MRVVLDSSIYISAALSVGGHSRSILKLAEKGWFEVWITNTITGEIERILKQKLRWPPGKIDLWVGYIDSFAFRIQPQQQVHDCSDPDDNHNKLHFSTPSAPPGRLDPWPRIASSGWV